MSKYRRKRVLFICIGNACRSPMAEAIARVDAYDIIDAFSAGLTPTCSVTELTKQTLMINGCWVDDLESKGISPKVYEQVDIVIDLSDRPGELVFEGFSKVAEWRIEDPFGKDLDAHQRVFEKIRMRVAKLAQECREELAREGSEESAPVRFRECPARGRPYRASPVSGVKEETLGYIKNWIAAQESPNSLPGLSDGVGEKQNPRWEGPDSPLSEPLSENLIPGASTEVMDNQGEASLVSPAPIPTLRSSVDPPRIAPGTYSRTGVRSTKKDPRRGWRLAGEQGIAGVLSRRWGTPVILGSLVGLIAFTVQSVTVQHHARSEMTAGITQKPAVLSQAVKPVAPPPLTTAPGVPNPLANKTQAQSSYVEPIPLEEVERIVESFQEVSPKRSSRGTSAAKKASPGIAVKTPTHPVGIALTRGHMVNALLTIPAGGSLSSIAKTRQQTASSLSPTPPQLETSIAQPAILVPHPSNDVRAPESETKANSAPAAKQPANSAGISGAVAILADPYPSLRIPNGSSKKQRQGTSLQLGHLLSRVEPAYPEDAKQQGIEGTVKLHAVIDRHGSVQSLQSVNGPPVLVAAAMNAVRQWRFSETLLAGRSVETEEDIDIVFRLSNPETPRK